MASRFRNAGRVQISFFSFQDIITSVTGILILVTLILSFYLNPPAAADRPAVPVDPAVEVTQAILDAVRSSNRLVQAELTDAASAPDIAQLEQQLRSLEDQERQIAGKAGSAVEQRASLQEILSTNQVLEGISANLRDELNRAQRALEAERNQTNAVYVIRGSRQTHKKPVMVQISGGEIIIERLQGAPRDTRTLQGGASGAASAFAAALTHYQKDEEYFVFLVKPSGISTFRTCLHHAKNANFEVGYEPMLEEATATGTATPPL